MVNSYAAASDSVEVRAPSKDDFPTEGKPINATRASPFLATSNPSPELEPPPPPDDCSTNNSFRRRASLAFADFNEIKKRDSNETEDYGMGKGIEYEDNSSELACGFDFTFKVPRW